MQNYENYNRSISTDVEESLSKIVNKITDYSIVLDVGCSSGMLGRYLSEKKGCIVDGVDIDEGAIELISAKYRFTAVKNLESEILTDLFKTETYDYIVVADLIEHLVNPNNLLSELKKLIKPHGTIIFSVPNITHIAVGFELLLGNFVYKDTGLLDKTHVRFYSKKSLLDKLQEFGLYAWEVDAVEKDVGETEFTDHIAKFFPKKWIDNLLSQREDALTYQWLVSTRIYHDISQPFAKFKKINDRKPLPIFSSELYWVDNSINNFNENQKIIGRVVSNVDGMSVIDFCFGGEISLEGLQRIRIDPISDQKPFLISHAEILDDKGNVVWTWQLNMSKNELFGARVVGPFNATGMLCQAISDDPQWHPIVNNKVLSQITAGWVFRMSLLVDSPLIYSVNMRILEQQATILNSITWRITKPLRFIENSFIRLFKS